MLSIDISKDINTGMGPRSLIFRADIQLDKISGIYGNSGQGKSIIFKIISGLIEPTQGVLSWKNTVWHSSIDAIHVKTQKRNIGYLFQEDSLFPHFTVKQNILYSLPKDERTSFDLQGILEAIEMDGFQDVYPHRLSGGQKQRTAIARSLARKSELILLDEPFSALDYDVKRKLYALIRSFKEKFQLTILIASHDVRDIEELCEEVIWLENFRVNKILHTKEFLDEINIRYI